MELLTRIYEVNSQAHKTIYLSFKYRMASKKFHNLVFSYLLILIFVPAQI